MPRRSRRTISDDIHCINNNHYIRLSLLFLLFWPIIMTEAAIITNDDDTNSKSILSILGLPRKNHCAIYYNDTLFILKGQSIESSLAIKFTNDSFIPSSTQFPSIQWIKNKNDSNVQQQQSSICTVTSYGQAIIFHSIQNNDTIDLNTMNWTSSSSTTSSSIPTNFIILTTTIMKDDMILVLGYNNNNNNNNALLTWILDASDDQLQWTWTQLTSPVSFLLKNENSTLISTTMTTTTSYILYFGVNQFNSIDFPYHVSVYCFDILSLTWMGSLLNFTSTTNHIQSVMINNINNNDTLLIIPDWIDTTIIHATSSDINVTNTYAQSESPGKNKQIQQQKWRWNYQQLPNNTFTQSQGFWILNIDTSSSSSSSLPLFNFTWQPTTENIDYSINGGSVTLIGNTVVFYGGENVTQNTPLLTSSINTGTDSSNNFELRFWNFSSPSFLATPAWLSPFLFPSSSSTPTASASTFPNTSDTYGDGNNKVVIILATLLGIFGLAFLCVLGLLLYRRKKNQHHETTTTATRELGVVEEEQDIARQHDTPIRIDEQQDNAATWAAQLHRSFSAILQRLRPSTTRKIPTVAGKTISAPLEANDTPIIQSQQDNDVSQYTPTSISPISPPPISSSNLTHSAPQSTRNSWREGSLKASRFVEHF